MIGILLRQEELIAACGYLILYVSVMPVAYITYLFAFIWFAKGHRYRHLCVNGNGIGFIVLAVFEMLHIVVRDDSFNAILNIFLYIFIAIVINSSMNYQDAIYIINSYTSGLALFVAELVIYEILYKGISLSEYLLSIGVFYWQHSGVVWRFINTIKAIYCSAGISRNSLCGNMCYSTGEE
jgi:hypothetical protein